MPLRILCALLVSLHFCGPVWADFRRKVTQSFVNVDLPHVLKFLAKEMGRNIYIAPQVKGSVTLKLVDVPAIEALGLVLEQQKSDYEFKVLDGPSVRVVIIAPQDKLEEICAEALGCRMRSPSVLPPRIEFFFEEPLAESTFQLLKEQFPQVEFTPHSTENGFYAKGPRETLLEIRRELVRRGLL